MVKEQVRQIVMTATGNKHWARINSEGQADLYGDSWKFACMDATANHPGLFAFAPSEYTLVVPRG